MPVDPAIPTSVPPVTPTSPAEADLDPDALEDEDFREELQKHRDDEEVAPPVTEAMPPADEPTPLSDDLR